MCQAQNASLLTIENMSELSCLLALAKGILILHNAFKKNLLVCHADFIAIGNDFWTSGSNEGPNCDVQDVYGWCSAGGPIDPPMVTNYSFWLSKAASPMQRCLTLSFDSAVATVKIGMKHADCTNKIPVVCERNDTNMNCGQLQQKVCGIAAPKNVVTTQNIIHYLIYF
jgi:hypothetical protein